MRRFESFDHWGLHQTPWGKGARGDGEGRERGGTEKLYISGEVVPGHNPLITDNSIYKSYAVMWAYALGRTVSETFESFDQWGLHQIPNSFVTDEDPCGGNMSCMH